MRIIKGRQTLCLRSFFCPPCAREMCSLGRCEVLYNDTEKAEEENMASRRASCWLEAAHVAPPDFVIFHLLSLGPPHLIRSPLYLKIGEHTGGELVSQ